MRKKCVESWFMEATTIAVVVAIMSGCSKGGAVMKSDDASFIKIISNALEKCETDDIDLLLPSEEYLDRFWEVSMHKTGQELRDSLEKHTLQYLNRARQDAAESGFEWGCAKLIRVYELRKPSPGFDKESNEIRLALESVRTNRPKHIAISELLPLTKELEGGEPGSGLLFFRFQGLNLDTFVAISTIMADERRVIDPLFFCIRMYEMVKRHEP